MLSCAVAGALLGVFGTAAAAGEGNAIISLPSGSAGRPLRVEARFVDRASGLEAVWDATGQLLVPAASGENALASWRGTRVVSTTASRQVVLVSPGGGAALRVGRGVPFAGWLHRFGRVRGYLDTAMEWREVETTLALEAESRPGEGGGRLVLTPAFEFPAGRARRVVVYAGQRVAVVANEGEEFRLPVPGAEEEFFRHFLAGYDLVRRVRPVDLVLRVSSVPADASEGDFP
jgi:hypothetical protein